jgi:hypothetical protein
MLRRTKKAILSILTASSLLIAGTLTATAASKLPDPTKAGFAEKLYRLDCGHSLANDESVWTPGRKCRTEYRILVNLLAAETGKRMVALGYRCSRSGVERPQGLVDPAKIDRLPSGQDVNWSTRGDWTQDKRHCLCRAIPYAWRPHRQRSLVPGFKNSDAASRVYLDQFSRWDERQRE